MENMKKVEELERNLQELKQKASDLEMGLKNAERQIEDLKRSGYQSPHFYQNPQYYQDQQIYQNQQPVYYQAVSRMQPVQNLQPVPNPQPASNPQQISNPQQHQKAQRAQWLKKPENTSTESWVGKILMGAVASLLVFIALITFAKLLLPYLTDTIKIALMFIASIAVTTAGFVLSKKKPKNTFFTALMACGTVCIYLSIVVTKVSFDAISSVAMYVLLAIWAGVIIALGSKRHDWLFLAIGNLGYMVSVFFSGGLDDSKLIIPMLLYVIIIGGVYQAVFWKDGNKRKVQSIINAVAIFTFQMILTSNFRNEKEIFIVGAVSCIFAFGQFITYILTDLNNSKKEYFYLALLNCVLFLCSFLILNGKLKLPSGFTFAAIVIPAVILEALNIYKRVLGDRSDESILNIIASSVMLCAGGLFALGEMKSFFNTGILLAVYALFVVYAVLKDDLAVKIQGYCIVLILAFAGLFAESGLLFLAVALILSAFAAFAEFFVNNNSVVFKAISHVNLIFWIFAFSAELSEQPALYDYRSIITLVTFVAVCAINAVMLKKADRKEVHLVMDILNVVFISYGLWLMNDASQPFIKVVYLVVTVLIACINLPIGEKGAKGRYLYAGIKLGTILLFALSTFNAPSFVTSVFMILFSVICIALGFKNRLLAKELRIFGLVLTMVFVVKFIVVDISFDNSVIKALSYLVSGILCFGISALYNYFEKQGKDGDENIGLSGQNKAI